jgi:hypothetical protein
MERCFHILPTSKLSSKLLEHQHCVTMYQTGARTLIILNIVIDNVDFLLLKYNRYHYCSYYKNEEGRRQYSIMKSSPHGVMF